MAQRRIAFSKFYSTPVYISNAQKQIEFNSIRELNEHLKERDINNNNNNNDSNNNNNNNNNNNTSNKMRITETTPPTPGSTPSPAVMNAAAASAITSRVLDNVSSF